MSERFKRGDRVARYGSYQHGTVIWCHGGLTLVVYDFRRVEDKETALEITKYVCPVEAGSLFEKNGIWAKQRIENWHKVLRGEMKMGWWNDLSHKPERVINNVEEIIARYDERRLPK